MINWRSTPCEPYNSICEFLAGVLYAYGIGIISGTLFSLGHTVSAICILIAFPIPLYYLWKGIRGFISRYRLIKIIETLNSNPSRS